MAKDGEVYNENIELQTLRKILQFGRDFSMIYLPSHDPASAKRLAEKEILRQFQDATVENALHFVPL